MHVGGKADGERESGKEEKERKRQRNTEERWKTNCLINIWIFLIKHNSINQRDGVFYHMQEHGQTVLS